MVLVADVSRFFASTWQLGTTAPVLSVIVPAIDVRLVWARATHAKRMPRTAMQRIEQTRIAAQFGSNVFCVQEAFFNWHVDLQFHRLIIDLTSLSYCW